MPRQSNRVCRYDRDHQRASGQCGRIHRNRARDRGRMRRGAAARRRQGAETPRQTAPLLRARLPLSRRGLGRPRHRPAADAAMGAGRPRHRCELGAPYGEGAAVPHPRGDPGVSDRAGRRGPRLDRRGRASAPAGAAARGRTTPSVGGRPDHSYASATARVRAPVRRPPWPPRAPPPFSRRARPDGRQYFRLSGDGR